jgi:hypothetical protein
MFPAPQFTCTSTHITFMPKLEVIQVAPSKQTTIKERVEVEGALTCLFIFIYDHVNGILHWNCFIRKSMQRPSAYISQRYRTRNTRVNAPLLHAISTQEVTRLNV